MRRLQYWHAALGTSVHLPGVTRDKQRVWSEYRNETVVYCLPGLEKADRWRVQASTEGPACLGCLAIPAEHLERLTVFHIGARGHVWGPQAVGLFESGSVEGLLDNFLSVAVEQGRILTGTPAFSMDLPSVKAGEIQREGDQLAFESFAIMPSNATIIPATTFEDADHRRILQIAWPPDAGSPPAVSPDAEAVERFRTDAVAVNAGGLGAVLPDGTWRPGVRVTFPSPFAELFGPGAHLDPWNALAKMRTIATLAARDPERALAMATTALAPYIADGRAPLWLACLGPDLMANRDSGPNVATWERYGLKGRTLDEAIDDPRADALVAVRRVWGGIGLLWALLVERLEATTSLSTCGLCGRPLEGVKRYCSESDNAACFRARRTADKRRSRATSAAHGNRPRA